MGVAHSIDVNGERALFDDLLEEYAVPCEVAAQCSDLLTRVDRKLEELEQKPEELSDKPSLPSKTTLKEMLAEMEQKLSEIEDRSKPFVEAIKLSSNLARKIDQVLHTWKIHPKKVVVKNTSFSEKSPQETLLDAEQKLSEIERRFEEIDKTSTRCSNILSRIAQLSKSLKAKVPEAPVQKVPFPPGEKFLAFIELRLSEIGNSLTVNKPNDSLIEELLTINATITHVMQQVPEAKADIIKQTLELRSLVDVAKQSIRANPELQAIHFDLLSLREMAREIDELIKVESNMGRCATTVFFEAWVPKLQLEKVFEEIKKITQGKCIIEEAPPNTEETVPTVIKPVPRFFEAFEKLTFSLGYPRPEEVNPVYIMAITFPFLFGIM
ncbi:MAG: V-type ATPase 116kDa subunit family protein, partial [Candidatus Wukongarchaeota archaeon]|nr:V-type ATPase 116kDa subunit family protein [Candidatus Wukongarchaeota archaeon]